jgi:N-acetylmuramoyl-L-alanine amidase
VKVRISLAGLAVALSLLVGGVAGIVAYRYAASGGKPRSAVPAPVAAPPPPVATTAVISQPAVRRADCQFINGNLQLTLTLDQAVPYDAHRLDHPDRVYIDLHGARLVPELAGRTLFVNNGGVSDIRLAQTQPDTVRVVLDLEKRFDYSVARQANPAAVVVKLRPHARRKRHPASSQPKKASPQ